MKSESPLQTWREKLDFLRKERATTASPDTKFQLDKQIEEAQGKIKELEYGELERQKKTNYINTSQKPKSKADLSHVISEDHKYNGGLVLVSLNFDKSNLEAKKIGMVLDISFGEVDEVFQYREGLAWKKASIRFGVKHGKLCLNLQNGLMPLHQRTFREDSQGNWQVGTTGIGKAPVWEFEASSQSATLRGSRCDTMLGTVDLSEDTYCIVEATFKVQINENDLEITAQSSGWKNSASKKEIETKKSLFFKRVVEPKLKEYLSKVVLKYDPAIVS